MTLCSVLLPVDFRLSRGIRLYARVVVLFRVAH